MSALDEPDWLAAEHDASIAALLRRNGNGRYQPDPTDFVDDTSEILDSWSPIDLAPVLAGAHTPPTPDILRTTDGETAFLYRRCVNGIHGDSGIGKSWIAAAAIAERLALGRRVVVLDYEATEEEHVLRLRALAVGPDAILGPLVYLRPQTPASDVAVGLVLQLIDDTTDLVVIDSLGEAFAVDGIDEDRDAQVSPWLRSVARRLADAGPAVLLIDHATKAADNPLHPSGSKRKRAAITGASYLVTVTVAPTRETAGTLTLTCAKDRHGTHQRGHVVATIDITPYPDGGVTVNLHRTPAATQGRAAPDERLALIARAMVRAVDAEGRPLSRTELVELAAVKAGTDTKRAAIDLAVGRRWLEVLDGARGAKLHQRGPVDPAEGEAEP